MKRFTIVGMIATVATAAALTGCASAETPSEEPAAETPETIAALDYESAEVLASIGLADRVVMMPEAVMNPVLGSHQNELGSVEHQIPVTADLDAEAVIDVFPDLTIMSPRHGAEARIGSVLEDAGVTTLELPNPWGSLEEITNNIGLIGEATGTVDDADALIEELETGLEADSEPGADAPRVLVLTNQAGRPFITAGDAMPLDIVNRAGARSVSEDLGVKVTGPISAEQIVEADPDGIVLIDMNGSGDKMYQDLLSNEAVASLNAVTEDRITRVEGKQVQAMGLTNMIDGREQLQEWIDTLP
ncbi:MAG: ABC transporter substrate-binding protein [Canibacter sp.]